MRRALFALSSSRSVFVKEVPVAELKSESDVLVQVHAVGLNTLDFRMSLHGYGSKVLDVLRGSEYVLGQEFSGVVTAVGKNVMDVCIGDQVYGAVDPWAGCGTATSVLRVHEANIARKPKSLSHTEAAALPFAVCTLWKHLIMRKRSKVVASAAVVGARGHVGSVAVALLQSAGVARVAQLRSPQETAQALQSKDTYDLVLDASSSLGHPLELEPLVAPLGCFVSLNGPWLTRVGASSVVDGSLSAARELLTRKAQQRTENGSEFHWAIMRGRQGRALRQVAADLDAERMQRPALLEQLHVVPSLEAAASHWQELSQTKAKKILHFF